MFDLGNMVQHLVREAKSLEEVEEKTAEVVFELGRAIWKLIRRKRNDNIFQAGP